MCSALLVSLLLCGCGASGTEAETAPISAAPAAPCAGLEADACSGRVDCVFDESCRANRSVCEGLTPARYPDNPQPQRPQSPRSARADRRSGDPCAALDRRCAYRLQSDSCVPFVLGMCDAPSEVFCDHPDQAPLECTGEMSCRCQHPVRCSGQPPPYGADNVGQDWVCRNDPQPDGCPAFAPEVGSPCSTADRGCRYSCTSLFECQAEVWTARRTAGPP